MSMSLRDQLIQAGLVTKKQAKQSARPTPDKSAQIAEQKRAADAALAAKSARDAELNRQQAEKADKKARRAQVKQLIEQNRVPKPEGDDYYNFIDGKKIKRIPVDAAIRARLVRGELMIARCEGRYDLVPAAIAERILERDEFSVIKPSVAEEKPLAEDDPYKAFVVPDDLKW